MVPAFTTSAWLAMPRCTHHRAHSEPLPRTLVKRQAIRHLQLLLGFLWGRIQDWVKHETGDSVDLIWDYTKQGQTYYGFNQHESRIEFVCGLKQMLPLCKNIPVLMMQARELQLVNILLNVKYGLEFSSSLQDQNATWDGMSFLQHLLPKVDCCLFSKCSKQASATPTTVNFRRESSCRQCWLAQHVFETTSQIFPAAATSAATTLIDLHGSSSGRGLKHVEKETLANGGTKKGSCRQKPAPRRARTRCSQRSASHCRRWP